MTKCRSCGARVNWVKTKKGKKMPIDYDPELSYLFDEKNTVEFEPALGMVSHFSSCEQADSWRNKK